MISSPLTILPLIVSPRTSKCALDSPKPIAESIRQTIRSLTPQPKINLATISEVKSTMCYRSTKKAACPQDVTGGVRNIANTPHSVCVGLSGVKKAPNNSMIDHIDISFTKHIQVEQVGDESLKLVKNWDRQSRLRKNNELQDNPRLAWYLQ